MIKHLVFWNLKDQAAGADKAANGAIIRERLEGLVGKIEGLNFLQVGAGVVEGNWDLCLYSEFDDLDALTFYRNHPLHLEVQKFVHEVITERAACDYESE